MKIINEFSWACITKNGKVKTGGYSIQSGDRISKVMKKNIENANTIFPCKNSYAVLTDSDKLFYWGTTPKGKTFKYIFEEVKEVSSLWVQLTFLS
jgi:hypothetical protein